MNLEHFMVPESKENQKKPKGNVERTQMSPERALMAKTETTEQQITIVLDYNP